MPENNGGRPATASRWRSGGLEQTTLGRAPPSDRLLNGFGLLPFSDITIILGPSVRDTIPADLQTTKENPCHPDQDQHHILSWFQRIRLLQMRLCRVKDRRRDYGCSR